MVHFLKEWMGVTTLCLVYSSMLVGWLLLFFSIGWPTFIGSVSVKAGVIIELVIFELVWIMMLVSHSATMCRDPGYVGLNYRYDSERLASKFQ